MNLFFWRKNKTIDRWAILLADEFYSQIQPELAKSYFEKKVSADKDKKREKANKKERATVDNAMSLFINQLGELRQEFDLGVYGKARLHMKFMNRLQELGYSEVVAKRLNDIIMVKTP